MARFKVEYSYGKKPAEGSVVGTFGSHDNVIYQWKNDELEFPDENSAMAFFNKIVNSWENEEIYEKDRLGKLHYRDVVVKAFQDGKWVPVKSANYDQWFKANKERKFAEKAKQQQPADADNNVMENKKNMKKRLNENYGSARGTLKISGKNFVEDSINQFATPEYQNHKEHILLEPGIKDIYNNEFNVVAHESYDSGDRYTPEGGEFYIDDDEGLYEMIEGIADEVIKNALLKGYEKFVESGNYDFYGKSDAEEAGREEELERRQEINKLKESNMKKQIKLKESDLRKMIEGKVMQALNEIGDTPAGRFMIGRLSARKGQNGNMPSEFGKFANSDSFTDGRIFQKNLQQFAADTSKSDDPRKVTFGELPKDEDYGADFQSYYPLSRLLVGHLSGVPEDDLQMNKYRQRMINQEKNPDRVSKGSMLKAEDPAIIPFDTTLRDYFGNDAKTNVASGLKESVVGPGDPEYDEFVKKYHEWEAENKRLNDTFWNTLTPEDDAFLEKSQGTFSRQSAINALKKKKGLLSPPMPTYSKNERRLNESQFRKIVENKVREMLKEEGFDNSQVQQLYNALNQVRQGILGDLMYKCQRYPQVYDESLYNILDRVKYDIEKALRDLYEKINSKPMEYGTKL